MLYLERPGHVSVFQKAKDWNTNPDFSAKA